VDALARDLMVVARAKENGKLELPSSSSSELDETEYAITERIFSDRKAANQTLIDQLGTYAQRRTALDFRGRFTVIQHAAPTAVSEFRTEANLGRDELHRLRRALVENEQERNHFRDQHRLRRVPRVSSPATTFLKLTLLAFLFVSETYINGVFLAKGNALGFIGGVAEAMVSAVLNVLISFGIGLGGLRQLNHRRLFRKLLGFLALVVWMTFAVFLNLALAHYREVSGAFLDDAGAQVITRLWQSPAALSDIKSWLFFGIGFVWSAVALIDGIFFTDPYPGYAQLERRVHKAHQEYINCKQDLVEQLRDIKDDATSQMQEVQSDLNKRRAEHASISAARSDLIQLFEQHQDQLEHAGNALLAKYRTANRQIRSSPAPNHFNEHWAMGRISIPVEPPHISGHELDQEIRKSQEVLCREIIAIHETFEQAVETYHEIDKLLPEQRHAAFIKKSA
jgi:hypothetical protein